MKYKERITAIECPECGSREWKENPMVSCSNVPFEAICVKCDYVPDDLTNRRLCPQKEFVMYNRDGNIIRHLECITCGKELLDYEMECGEYLDKTVWYFNQSAWILPGKWISDGSNIFCSKACRDNYTEEYDSYD